jgi:tetratricopeptide (TPR) repeat protein
VKTKVVQIVLAVFMVAGCTHRPKIAVLTAQAAEAMAKNNYEQAIKDYSEVIRLDSQYAPAFAARGDAFVILGKFDEGIQDLSEAIRLDPKNYLAYQLRGTAYYGKQQFDKAISDLNFALEDKSDDPDTLKLRGEAFKIRGLAYFEKHSFDNAIADFTEALNMQPYDSEIYDDRGDIYRIQNEMDKAFDDFNHALQINPEDPLGLLGRGRVYSKTGSFTNAVQDFERVIRLKPKAGAVYNMFAWLLATCPDDQIRDGQRAVQLATKACDLSKWKKYAYVDTLAAAYAETGDFEQAVKYQKLAASMDEIPEDNRTNVQNRIDLYLRHKPYRKSNKAYD